MKRKRGRHLRTPPPIDLTRLPAFVLPSAAAIAAEPTAAAVFLGTGFVDVDRPAIEFPAIQSSDGAISFISHTHFNESETSGPSGITVGHDVHTVHRAIRLKQGSNRLFGSSEAEISNKNILHVNVNLLSEICRAANRGQDRPFFWTMREAESAGLTNYICIIA